MRNLQNTNIPSGNQLSHRQNSSYNKMDIMFYNSIKLSQRAYILKIIFHIVRLLLLVIFFPIDIYVVRGQPNNLINAFLGTAIGMITINLLIIILIYQNAYANNAENNAFFLNLADTFTHTVAAEPIANGEDIHDIKKCVSQNVYNQGTGALNNSQGLTDEIRKRYQTINSSMISNQMLTEKPCLSRLQINGKFLSFLIIIFGIVTLSCTKPIYQAQIGVLTTYLILQALNIWGIIVVVVLIALSPIICFACCLALCCCTKELDELHIPDAIQATPQIIEQTDGSCSICLQSFKPKELVVMLPCSIKHMFHKGCLEGWLKFSNTCPMCRKNVGQS